MTVAGLIKRLQTMPQDAICIRTICSDYEIMDDGDLELIETDSKKLAFSMVKDWRGGKHLRYHDYRPSEYPEGVQPNFVTVCHFHGN